MPDMIAIAAAEGQLYTELTARDRMPEGAVCLTATEKENVIGRIWYVVTEKHAELLFLSEGEEVLREGLVRAALNAAELAGAREALCHCADMAPLLERLKFLRGEEGWSVSIGEFFSRPCRGHQ